jgi:hypothetical protein
MNRTGVKIMQRDLAKIKPLWKAGKTILAKTMIRKAAAQVGVTVKGPIHLDLTTGEIITE